MSIVSFLSELRRRNIQVWVDGGQLRCSAVPGTLSGELLEQLRRFKADIVEFLSSAQALAKQERAIVPLQQNGTQAPVFGVPGHNGDVFCYRWLAQALGGEQPFFGLQPPGVDGRAQPLERIEDIAAYFAAQIGTFHPAGAPCVVAGFCAGGTVAFELAQQLARSGTPVRFLALFGCQHPSFFGLSGQMLWRAGRQVERIVKHADALVARDWKERCRYIADKLRRPEPGAGSPPDPVLVLRAKVERATVRAVQAYQPLPYPGRVALFIPSERWGRGPFGALKWRSLARTEEYYGPEDSDGDNMLRERHAAAFAELFRRCRDKG